MQRFRTLIIVAVACFSLASLADFARGDLIAPTRALEGESSKMGKLSIYSEPQGLSVFLDGQLIGETTIQMKSVVQGRYDLQIESTKTIIFIKPGGSHRYSYREGFFFEVKAKETKVQNEPDTAKTETAQPSETINRTGNEEGLEPGFFPLNPRGPIY